MYVRRPHTDRIPEGVSKMLQQNRNRDSYEKNATRMENTRILRIPAGICNLPPETMALHPPHDHPWLNLLSCIAYLTSIYFWLVVVFTIIPWWPSKSMLYFICDYFVVVQIVALNNGTTSPPRSNPHTSPPQPPHYHTITKSRLVVVFFH